MVFYQKHLLLVFRIAVRIRASRSTSRHWRTAALARAPPAAMCRNWALRVSRGGAAVASQSRRRERSAALGRRTADRAAKRSLWGGERSVSELLVVGGVESGGRRGTAGAPTRTCEGGKRVSPLVRS